MKKYTTIYILVVTATLMIFFKLSSAFAQDNPHQVKPYSIGAKGHLGFILMHHENMENIAATGHSKMFELSIWKQTTGKKEWEECYHYPVFGISYLYGDFGNPQYIGATNAIFPFIRFPYVRGKSVAVNFSVGMGLSYTQKPFDRIKNYKNNVIGSKVNGFVQFSNEVDYQINSTISVLGGLSFTHISNGAVKMPNLGFNLASVTAGLNYHIGQSTYLKKDTISSFHKSFTGILTGNMGFKQVSIGEETYKIYSLTASLYRSFCPKGRYGIGLDLFYDNSIRAEVEQDDNKENDNIPILQSGIHASYEFIISNISIPVHLGTYLYTKYDMPKIYNCIGLRYQINSCLLANLRLKAHYGRADYIEWGIGCKF